MRIRDIINSKKNTPAVATKKEVIGKNGFNGNYDADKFKKKVVKETEAE